MGRVAVVGGGIFGCTAAIKVAQSGFDVVLYEQESSLLRGATGHNQYRLHLGFHYPRSLDTASEARSSYQRFSELYRDALVGGQKHYYAIAREGSRVSASEYLKFCDILGLPYKITSVRDILDPDQIDLVVQVPEFNVDISTLRGLIFSHLQDAGVEIRLNTGARAGIREEYDHIIVATYALNGVVNLGFRLNVSTTKYQIVEKPVMTLPDAYRDTSVVVMDGEFCCVGPYGQSGDHVMGHVKEAVHAENIGVAPEIPNYLKPHINKGVIDSLEDSRSLTMVVAGAKYLPGLKGCHYKGSMYTIRAVLPHQEATDARPSLIRQLDDQVIQIFGGKLGSAVEAADECAQILHASHDKKDARLVRVA